MIACTFLLGLVKDGRDAHTNLGAYLQQNLGGPTTTDIQDLVKRLKARGGQEHMLMFLTGPAGSGKSSALMVAQQFCYEFCLSVGVMWSDKTFLFTAYTGSAASLFGGVTISKAAFINQNSALSLDDINEWQGVRLLIIDEISFMSNSVLKKLDKKLKHISSNNQCDTMHVVRLCNCLTRSIKYQSPTGSYVGIRCSRGETRIFLRTKLANKYKTARKQNTE